MLVYSRVRESSAGEGAGLGLRMFFFPSPFSFGSASHRARGTLGTFCQSETQPGPRRAAGPDSSVSQEKPTFVFLTSKILAGSEDLHEATTDFGRKMAGIKMTKGKGGSSAAAKRRLAAPDYLPSSENQWEVRNTPFRERTNPLTSFFCQPFFCHLWSHKSLCRIRLELWVLSARSSFGCGCAGQGTTGAIFAGERGVRSIGISTILPIQSRTTICVCLLCTCDA